MATKEKLSQALLEAKLLEPEEEEEEEKWTEEFRRRRTDILDRQRQFLERRMRIVHTLAKIKSRWDKIEGNLVKRMNEDTPGQQLVLQRSYTAPEIHLSSSMDFRPRYQRSTTAFFGSMHTTTEGQPAPRILRSKTSMETRRSRSVHFENDS